MRPSIGNRDFRADQSCFPYTGAPYLITGRLLGSILPSRLRMYPNNEAVSERSSRLGWISYSTILRKS